MKRMLIAQQLLGLAHKLAAPEAPKPMRRFELHRKDDETGVSGTGIVAQGVVFSDGKAAMRWLTDTASTAFYDDIKAVETIHGHDGKTTVVWVDEAQNT